MKDIMVYFQHPTDGGQLSVELDGSITAEEIIEELIQNEFVPPSKMGYDLGIKSGPLIQEKQTLTEAGVGNNTVIRVIPATDAGSKRNRYEH